MRGHVLGKEHAVLEAGAEFGPFRILGVLGVGGMGSVYHAFQANPPRDVALKVIGTDLAAQPTFRARFKREAEVLARLEHPNILPLYETGEIDGRPYICSRYVRGGTLKDLLDRVLTAAEAAALLEPVAEALDFAHGRGVIHRDIKPSNILLTEPDARGRRAPIVADFGLARLLEAGPANGPDGAPLTQIGMGLGTPSHMAPEQVLGYPLDGRADQYALAITTYQLLTGMVPFAAATPSETAIMQVREPPPPPSRHNRQINAAVDDVILRGLAKPPEQRYARCSDFIAALAEAAHSADQTPEPTAPAFPLLRSQPPPTVAIERAAAAAPLMPATGRTAEVPATLAVPPPDDELSFGQWVRPSPAPVGPPQEGVPAGMPPTMMLASAAGAAAPRSRRRLPSGGPLRLALAGLCAAVLLGGSVGGVLAYRYFNGPAKVTRAAIGPREIGQALRNQPITQAELPPPFRPSDVTHFDPNALEAQFHEADEVTYNLLAGTGETDRLNYLLFASPSDAAGYVRADTGGGFSAGSRAPQARCKHSTDGSGQGTTFCDVAQGAVVVEALSFVRTSSGQGNDGNATQLVTVGISHLQRVMPK